MGIKLKDFRNYYSGLGVENYFIYKFMSLNYEASKIHPDYGLDLHITNNSIKRFLGKPSFECFLQIKSTFDINDGKISFSISKDVLDLIRSTENSYLILARLSPSKELDPYSYKERYDLADRAIDSDIKSFSITRLKDDRKSESNIADEIIDYSIDYIWLNRAHIERLVKENMSYFNLVKETYWLNICTEPQNYYTSDTLNWHNIIPEIKNIYFLINKCESKELIDIGYLTYGDYWSNDYTP